MGAALGLAAACGLTSVGTSSNPDDLDAADGHVLVDGTTIDRNAADGGLDAVTDARVDVIVDAAPDVPVIACPTGICNGGCDGGVCTIDCNAQGDCQGNVTCPAGLPCHVRCLASDRCSNKTITCPNTAACTISCLADQACQNTVMSFGTGPSRLFCGVDHQNACQAATINAQGTAQFCMVCNGPVNNPGCANLQCSVQAATCKKECQGLGCMNIEDCNDCANQAGCP
jgi:hypothetical protein